MSSEDNSKWFARIAFAVWEMVVDHKGAMVVIREQLKKELVDHDPRLAECPPCVIEHVQCAIAKKAPLKFCGYYGRDNSVLLIWVSSESEQWARVKVKDKLPDGVQEPSTVTEAVEAFA